MSEVSTLRPLLTASGIRGVGLDLRRTCQQGPALQGWRERKTFAQLKSHYQDILFYLKFDVQGQSLCHDILIQVLVDLVLSQYYLQFNSHKYL